MDRANSLLEQTETLCTAAHRGRCDGGNGKNSLAGRVSPSGDLRTQLLRLDVRIELIDHGDLYLWRPLPPIRYNYVIRAIKPKNIHLAGGRPVMSLSFPTLPDGLDLPTRYFVSLYISKPS